MTDAPADSLDLTGTWRLGWSDGQRGLNPSPFGDDADPAGMIDAVVPGEVHLDLWRAGLIPDPYRGTGCLSSRWVEEYLWFYRREFDAPTSPGRAWLVFEELDLAARVYLNGEMVGTHRNVFRPCRLDVTDHLRPGRNLLVVELESGLFDIGDRPATGYAMYRDAALHKRHWLRKPQSQFTWDWSTRLINVGLSGPVRLEWTPQPVRLDRMVALSETEPDLRHARVTARAFVEGLTDAPVTCRLEATIEGGPSAEVELTIKPGLHPYEIDLEVDDPGLWWPVGAGSQPLSTVTARLTTEGWLVGEATRRVGFRTIRFDQSPDPDGTGSRFVLEVNGRPVFCKGANLVPADMIFQRADHDRYQKLVDLALEANFNFLRVWGGGLYESEHFYDLCDELGILVWQEFIFACSRYPSTDPGFYEEVKLEATHQVRRLAHHPSLVAWCGNNENEWGAWDWSFDKEVVLPDHALYHLVLPRILAKEDPHRYYQASSPFSPDGSHPNRDEVGDQHPWSVGFANRDFRDYRDMACRYPNEGGILGPTSLATMRECLDGGPERVGSFAWRVHDNVNGPHADGLLELWLGLDATALTVEEYTYWAGLVHGEGLREYCENFRRRMFDSAAAVFWMYNDCWPATRSWTIVDYHLRRTPAFAPVRRAMAPVAVVLADEGDEVGVFGVNDTDEPATGTLRFGLVDVDGAYVLDRTIEADVRPNASTRLASFPKSAWPEPTRTIAFAMLQRDGETVARGRLILPLFKEMAWPDPQLKVRLDGDSAVFETDRYCWGVCLDLDGDEPIGDNFFDVWPGIPHRVAWARSAAPTIVKIGNDLTHVHLTT